MAKYHQKSMAVPKTWPLQKKKTTFVTRPLPSGHKLHHSMPLSIIMKDVIKCSQTSRESKNIAHTKEIIVDGKRRKDIKIAVGLMDVISLPAIKENYRITLDSKGRITAVKIDDKEKEIKLCRIIGKKTIKGNKQQLNMSDGRNIILKKESKENYKVGDSLLITLPKNEIKSHFAIEKGMAVFITDGKKSGSIGALKEIKKDTIVVSSKGEEFETAKKYAYIIGKDKPIIKISE